MGHSPDIIISKRLTWLLRHGDPAKTGLRIRSDGFTEVDEILEQVGISFDRLCYIVENDPKGRFKIVCEDGINLIRANQGHSLQIIDDDKLLSLINVDDKSDMIQRLIVHGTYLDKWQTIKENGLSRMSRSHIHFVPAKNFKLESNKQTSKLGVENLNIDQIAKEMCAFRCKSGIRPTSEVLIFIDMANCISEKMEYKFYTSENNVILTRGNQQGLICPEMFLLCIDIKNGEVLLNNISDEQTITEVVRFIINSMRSY
ncbi:tRNA splicing 2' phosphotransferase-like protein [Cryptosporidium canis]|nr:tRNA splicing 2' phosphotransferase-like protein [Cryptosporidium canis]